MPFLLKDTKEIGGGIMKDKIFGVLQRIGRSFMLPIAILPVAGLLLGIGGSFTNTTMLESYHLLGIMGPGTVWYTLFYAMSKAGDIVLFAKWASSANEVKIDGTDYVLIKETDILGIL